MRVRRDSHAPLSKHLEELRWRILICVITLLLGSGICFGFFDVVSRALLAPAEQHLSSTGEPIFTEVTELFSVTVKICFLGGLILALPMLVYQGIMFVAPALTPTERRWAIVFVPSALLAFLGGAAFAYFVILPTILRFLLTFGGGMAEPMIRIGNYLNLVVTLISWMGFIFETPLVMLLLTKANVISTSTLARGRRFAVVLAFVLGAVITPTFDPANQALVAIPFILLYEMGIWLSRLGNRRKRR